MNFNEAITAATTFSGLACPKCSSQNYRKHGHCLGIQRYRCKQCGRYFKETINTPLHGIHNKPKMQQYISSLIDQHTIRKAACLLEISVSTSFAWRHKLLSSLQCAHIIPAQTPVVACQINLPHSFKGKRQIPDKPLPATRTFLVADARGIPYLHLMPPKCTALEASKPLRILIEQAPSVAIAPAKLLTKASKFAVYKHITHSATQKKLLQVANIATSRLSGWMVRFHGVATKYLQQYWNWYRVQTSVGATELFATECLAHRNLLDYRHLIQR